MAPSFLLLLPEPSLQNKRFLQGWWRIAALVPVCELSAPLLRLKKLPGKRRQMRLASRAFGNVYSPTWTRWLPQANTSRTLEKFLPNTPFFQAVNSRNKFERRRNFPAKWTGTPLYCERLVIKRMLHQWPPPSSSSCFPLPSSFLYFNRSSTTMFR